MEERRAAVRASKRGKAKKFDSNSNGNVASVGDNSPAGPFAHPAAAPTDSAYTAKDHLSDNLSVGAVSVGAMNMANIAAPRQSRRPKDNSFMQQRVRSYIVLLTPSLAIVFFLCIAALCFTVGILLRNSLNHINSSSITYEGKYSSKPGCEVSRVRMYSISIVIPRTFRGNTCACVVHLYLKLSCMKATALCVCVCVSRTTTKKMT